MAKFKVGDIVVGNSKANDMYGITTEGSRLKVTNVYIDGTFSAELIYHPTLDGYIGTEFGIHEVIKSALDPDCFDLFENKKIVIIKRDDSVMARLYSAEKLVKEANVDSTGDFNKDAKDAFDSLYKKYSARDIIQEIYDSLPDVEKKVLDFMVETGCSKKPTPTVKIYETISYKEFRWDE